MPFSELIAHHDAVTYEQCHTILNRLRLTSHKKNNFVKRKKEKRFSQKCFYVSIRQYIVTGNSNFIDPYCYKTISA